MTNLIGIGSPGISGMNETTVGSPGIGGADKSIDRTKYDLLDDIIEVKDVPYLIQIIHKLYTKLDDIDTISDIAKFNHEVYRKLVENIINDRIPEIATDGYNIYLLKKV
jgi:hypothetical protein